MRKSVIASISGVGAGVLVLSGVGIGLLTSGHAAAAPAPVVTHSAPAAPTQAPKIIINNPAPAPTKTIYAAPPAAPAPAAPAGLHYVGNGIYANGSTSDAFARNVVSSWNGTYGVQYVYSPVTGQTYAMTYQAVGSNVIATGGNNAYVQF